MAITIPAKAAGKYAVVETNHVSAVRTGNMAAQYSTDIEVLQNGMAVNVDHETKKIVAPVAGEPLYLHASEEQIYEDHLGRDTFYIKAGQYPRALKLEIGDIFETDAVVAEDYTVGDILTPDEDGFWAANAAPTAGSMVAQVVGEIYLPNGKPGVKLAIVQAPTL